MGKHYSTGNLRKDATIEQIRRFQGKVAHNIGICVSECMCCGKPFKKGDKKELHHIHSVKSMWEDKERVNDLDNLIVLCHDCHRSASRRVVREDLDIRDSLFNMKYIRRLTKLDTNKINYLIERARIIADKSNVKIPDTDNTVRIKRRLNAINNGIDNWVDKQETDIDDIINRAINS